jgi:twitching motility protein PilT
MTLSIRDLLAIAIERGASTLHLSAGTYPKIRLYGKLLPLTQAETLTPQNTLALVSSILTDAQANNFLRGEQKELDFAVALGDLGRFRVNVYREHGGVGAAIRVIPVRIPSFEQLGLAPGVEQLAGRSQGLVLVTGTTGSGKTTTLAAIVDKINSELPGHIVTIEDPIEFVHSHKKCNVNQREVHAHTDSFHHALKSVLRQDPDVILVGEMRDLETVQAALTVAETGHLTFGSLHTNSGAQTITRIISLFPPHQQAQIRAQLSMVLEGVVSQALIPRADGAGLVLAQEVLLTTPAIRNLIREDRLHQIYSTMQAGTKFGMQTMNQALARLVQNGLITKDEAMNRSTVPDELAQLTSAAPGPKPQAVRAIPPPREHEAVPA